MEATTTDGMKFVYFILTTLANLRFFLYWFTLLFINLEKYRVIKALTPLFKRLSGFK